MGDNHPVERGLFFGWMKDSELMRIVAALDAAGGEPRFIGGCVRDGLLGYDSNDIDLASPLTLERIEAALDVAKIRHRIIGKAYGVVQASCGARTCQIAPLRKDMRSIDGRQAIVIHGVSWHEDALRRDFTMNALSLSPDGDLYDDHGGRTDLYAGRVRFIGVPSARIAEDRLRILRFFRFLATHGTGAPDRQALDACAQASHEIDKLPPERIRGEITRLFATPEPMAALAAMRATLVIDAVFGFSPSPDQWAQLERLLALERDHVEPDWLRRLACLGGSEVERLKDRLRLTREELRRWRIFLDSVPTPGNLPVFTPNALAAAMERDGADATIDCLLLAWARSGEKPGFDGQWRTALSWILDARNTAPPFDGSDLLAFGCDRGPELGELLRTMRIWWLLQSTRPARAACLAEMKARLK